MNWAASSSSVVMFCAQTEATRRFAHLRTMSRTSGMKRWRIVTIEKRCATSAAMTSEAIHSIVDTTNEILLLYGIHRSRQKADTDHPFGHGRELYFWSFVVSLLIFALGAGFSIYEGIYRILYPIVSFPVRLTPKGRLLRVRSGHAEVKVQ